MSYEYKMHAKYSATCDAQFAVVLGAMGISNISGVLHQVEHRPRCQSRMLMLAATPTKGHCMDID
jgi:hypothetical protein